MLQESTTSWDLRNLPIETSPAERLYMLFLLVVFIVGSGELIRIWHLMRPSKLPLPAQGAEKIKQLQTAATRLKQWIYLNFLACGFFASYELYRESTRLLVERTHSGLAELLSLQGFFVLLEMTFLVAIFVFLVRWTIVRRITKFND